MNNEVDQDLVAIARRKAIFVQKCGGLEIASDVEFLLKEVAELRKKEREYGYLNTDQREIIAAYRHLAIKDHKWIPKECAMCATADAILKAMKAGEM